MEDVTDGFWPQFWKGLILFLTGGTLIKLLDLVFRKKRHERKDSTDGWIAVSDRKDRDLERKDKDIERLLKRMDEMEKRYEERLAEHEQNANASSQRHQDELEECQRGHRIVMSQLLTTRRRLAVAEDAIERLKRGLPPASAEESFQLEAEESHKATRETPEVKPLAGG